MNPEHEQTPRAAVDDSGSLLVRAPGCAIAFLVFIIAITIPSIIPWQLPATAMAVVALVLGVGCVALFNRAVAKRWGATPPDIVQLVGHDITVVLRRGLDDYRLRLPASAPFGEHARHEALYVLKWTGHLLIITGLGFLLYRLMVATGLVS